MSGQQDQSEIDPELEQALQEWNELWEQFEASDLNRKFDLAERLVRHSDGFEPEHVFEFVNRLWEACETPKERVRYREFLESLDIVMPPPEALESEKHA